MMPLRPRRALRRARQNRRPRGNFEAVGALDPPGLVVQGPVRRLAMKLFGLLGGQRRNAAAARRAVFLDECYGHRVTSSKRAHHSTNCEAAVEGRFDAVGHVVRLAGWSWPLLDWSLALIGGAARRQPRGGNWQVVLAAGDDAEPVFDDATRDIGPAAARGGRAGWQYSSAERQRRRAAPAGSSRPRPKTCCAASPNLPARPGDRCLVFLTSHGEPDAGLWLARSQRALPPEELAQALSRGCAAVPTVVIVSSLLQRRLCRRGDGQAQPHHPDRGAPRSAVFRLPGRAHLYLFRRLPARRVAESGELEGRCSRATKGCVAARSTRSASGPPSRRPISVRRRPNVPVGF